MKKQSFWKKLNMKKFNNLLIKLASCAGLLIVSNSAFASSTGSTLPFVSVLSTVASAISGPVAFSVATIMVVGTGLMNAFGEFGEGMKKLINIVFWCSIAFGVASLLATFGSTGATF